jgi:hypothetical protein
MTDDDNNDGDDDKPLFNEAFLDEFSVAFAQENGI